MQITTQAKINKTSIKNKRERITSQMLSELTHKLDNMAYMATMQLAPVWSGGYVNSFSMKVNNTSSRGRRRASGSKKVPEGFQRESGYSNLQRDIQQIEAMDLKDIQRVTFRNDHVLAYEIEHGSQAGAKALPNLYQPDGYHVFGTIKATYG